MERKLKLLAGELGGAEYALAVGDTVFVTGPRRDLLDGTVAQALADADNLFFIPDGDAPTRFVIRCGAAGDEILLGLPDADGVQRFAPVAPQRAHRAGHLWFAVRDAREPWSIEVLDFEPPRESTGLVLPAASTPQTSTAPAVGRKPVALGMLAVALVAAAGFAWMRGSAPSAQVMSLETALRNGPVDYAIAYGRDARLHAFSESDEGVAWGMRAVERLGKSDTVVFLERGREIERLGRKLTEAGLEFVVIRLHDPKRPEIVMSVAENGPPMDVRKVRDLLLADMPYAESLDVTSISDQRLAAMVRDDLRSRGIPSHVHASADRIAVSNEVALDDAGLHAMAEVRNAFVARWGDRRLSINIQLWDDLLKGSSFHYTPAKLLSMGGGVWNFSTATQDGPGGPEDFR